MRTLLDFLKLLANLLLQVTGRAIERLRSGFRKAASQVRRALGRVRDVARSGREPLWNLYLLVKPSWSRVCHERRAMQAALVRFEQLVGWRLGGVSTGESHVLAA